MSQQLYKFVNVFKSTILRLDLTNNIHNTLIYRKATIMKYIGFHRQLIKIHVYKSTTQILK